MSFFTKTLATKLWLLLLLLASSLAAAVYAWQTGVWQPQTPQLLGAVGVVAGIFLVWFVWQVMWPLETVTEQMQRVLSRKAYTQVTLPPRHDEIGTLTKFFNAVVTSLEQVSTDIVDRQRLAKELGFAAKLQRHLLPKAAPRVPGLDVLVKTKFATEVGGDNFDIIHRPESTLFYVGDATGHGSPASIVMSMVNVLVHTFASSSTDPHAILAQTNRFLHPKLSAAMFMTLAMLRWEHNQKQLFYTGCGHEHILVYRAASQTCEAIKTGGIALGMVPEIEKLVREKSIDLQPNDAVVLYTDGITEAKNAAGEMFGVERLRAAVARHGYQNSARGIFSGISKEFAQFVGQGHVQADDITLLVLKRSADGAEYKLQLDVDTTGLHGAHPPNWDWEE